MKSTVTESGVTTTRPGTRGDLIVATTVSAASPAVAMMRVTPGATALTSPAASRRATSSFSERHATVAELTTDPPESVTAADSLVVPPTSSSREGGTTLTDATT